MTVKPFRIHHMDLMIFFQFLLLLLSSFPANTYLLKVNNRNTRKRYEICSELTIKTTKQCHHFFFFVQPAIYTVKM